MPAPYKYVEGWTAPIDRNLLKDGATFDATGLDAPVLILVDIRTGRRVVTTGDVSWRAITTSGVRFLADPGDIKVGTYRATWGLTESNGTISYFPNGDPEIWEVRAQ